MSNFKIHILDPVIRISYDMPCCIGEIQIGKFKETFEMPLVTWTMEDYQKQWQAGIDRIRKYDRSCLVSELHDLNKVPMAIIWELYKEGDKIYIQNRLLYGRWFRKGLKKRPFTAETCYEFVLPRETMSGDDPISEWAINVSDLGDV